MSAQLNYGGWYMVGDNGNLVLGGSDEASVMTGIQRFMSEQLNISGEAAINPADTLDNSGLTLTDPTLLSGAEADVVYAVDGSDDTGKLIANKLAIMNQWNYSQNWLMERPLYFPDNMEFVEYIQFMTATGGEQSRDLFIDPLNGDVTDDYNFTPLVTACRNVLKQNIKTFIKTGNIPLKYSSKTPELGTFGVNIFEPYDYDMYRAYIAAMAEELVKSFGLDEVRTWKWGVYTEYENSDWFKTGTPAESCIAYCKIYDYTVDALQSVLGEDIFIGAHSMTCADGLWDEREFIRHCANGTNYCTGRVGTRVCYLASSFYDIDPNNPALRGVVESINILKKTADECGLTGLIFGIDEGRLLNGCDNLPLTSRVVGHTYQAGYDARMIKIMIDNDIDYFATWCYLTGNAFNGLKTVSHHVASRFYKMVGSSMLDTALTYSKLPAKVESDIVASYNAEQNKVYIMAYNFKFDMLYDDQTLMRINLSLPMFDGDVKVTRYLVDDDSNFFDEWYNASTPNSTGWSVDSAQIILPFDPSQYEQYSQILPTSGITKLTNSGISLETPIKGCSVVFYVIEQA